MAAPGYAACRLHTTSRVPALFASSPTIMHLPTAFAVSVAAITLGSHGVAFAQEPAASEAPSQPASEPPTTTTTQPQPVEPLPPALQPEATPLPSEHQPGPYATTPEPPPVPSAVRHQRDKDAPRTLFDPSAKYAIGGFGGLSVAYSRVADTDGVLVCGEGAVLIDHSVSFGAGGCGWTAPTNVSHLTGADRDRLFFGYGGAVIRYHFLSREVVNIGVGTLIGAGGYSIQTKIGNSGRFEDDYRERSSEAAFVLEPEVGAYLNITRWLRVGAKVGYRWVAGVSIEQLSDSDLSYATAGGSVQMGWF